MTNIIAGTASAMASEAKELIVYRRKRSRDPLKLAALRGKLAIPDAENPESVSPVELRTKNRSQNRRMRSNKYSVKEPSNALTIVRGTDKPLRPSGAFQRTGLGSFRVGTSGYVYKDWKKIIYPEWASSKEWFHLYTRLFDTVEINNTFYRLPSPAVMDDWRSQAPAGFCYALKFSRFGTHMKRLKDPDGPISLFLERASSLGQDCVGPILVQLPPKFNLDIDRLREFLERAPQQYRWAIEFRDSRWLCDDVYSLLHAYNASLCIHDHKDISFPHPQVLTANWIYVRFHGYDYRQCYNRDQLQTYALWIKEQLESGVDVYAYFNNDYSGNAPYNALDLRELVLEFLL